MNALRFEFDRSDFGYGWWITLYICGKHRARFNSFGATTPMLPKVMRGADEHCNRATTLMLWPLGHIDIWWEPNWRTEGCCDECAVEMAALGMCVECGCKPCFCMELAS